MKKNMLLVLVVTAGVVPAVVSAQLATFDYGRDTVRSADEITLILKAGDYEIVRNPAGEEFIVMEAFDNIGSPGDPLLPVKYYDVAVPPNIDLSTIELEVDAEVTELPGKHQIAAEPPMFERIDEEDHLIWGQGKRIVDGRNANVYQVNAYYPARPVEIATFSRMRKWKYVRIAFYPVQYNPRDGSLKLIENAEVKITFDRIGSRAYRKDPMLRDRTADRQARRRFENFKQYKRDYKFNANKYTPDGYAIITTNAIVAGSGAVFENFVAHKKSLGLDVMVVTEDQYGLMTGQAPNQTAEKIRQWLRESAYWQNIRWVLLIGNPDPADPRDPGDPVGEVPMKMCWPASTYGSPTDYFYANLGGDWDLDDDGFYGEITAIDNPTSPDPLVGDETFSVRWTGRIESPETGTYRFYTQSDDGIRVIIAGDTVIDNWTPHYPVTDWDDFSLDAGDLNDVVIEFREVTGDAWVRFWWRLPSKSGSSAIPSDKLYYNNGSQYVPGGLNGSYYNNDDFTSLALSRVDPEIFFIWGTGDKGPEGVDFTPDLYVGRIPVYDNDYDTLNKILTKIIAYEQENLDVVPDWRKRALLPMEPTDDITPSYDCGEYIKDDILIPEGLGYYRIYDEIYDAVPPPEDTPCNVTNVAAEWPNGYGIITWLTHGGKTGAADVFSISYCSVLDDSKPGFTFQGSCHNGWPEASNNLGYSLLKHGAIGTVSGGRTTTRKLGKTPPSASRGCNHDLGYFYTEDLVYGKPAGEALYETTDASNHWKNNMLYNLYGDPTTSLVNQKFHKPFPEARVSCHFGGVFWIEDAQGNPVMIIDFLWCDPWWWLKNPVDIWEIDLQVGYNPVTTALETSYVINATVDLRFKPLGNKVLAPYLGAGPGYYRMGVTGANQFGANGCAGFDINLTPRLALEVGGSYHYLLDDINTQFVQGSVGILYGF